MEEPKVVFFTADQYKMILEYQRESEAIDVRTAIMNAISIALDHHEELVAEWTDGDGILHQEYVLA